MPPKKGKQRRRANKQRGKKPTSVIPKAPRDVGPVADINYVDTSYVATGVTTSGTVTLLSGIAEGSDNINRTGRGCRAVLLEYSFVFAMGSSTITTDNYNTIRMVIARDVSSFGTLPGPGAFLWTVTGANAPNSPINLNNAKRFEFLVDKISTVSESGPSSRVIRGPKKLNFDMRFGGSTASQADVFNNAVYCLMISDSAAVPNPTVTGWIRLYFSPKST